jgi:transposase
MIGFLLEVKNEADKAQGVSFDSTTVKQFEDRYKRIVGEGMKVNPPPEVNEGEKKRGRKKKSKARNLLERLEQYGKETLAFMSPSKCPLITIKQKETFG